MDATVGHGRRPAEAAIAAAQRAGSDVEDRASLLPGGPLAAPQVVGAAGGPIASRWSARQVVEVRGVSILDRGGGAAAAQETDSSRTEHASASLISASTAASENRTLQTGFRDVCAYRMRAAQIFAPPTT